MNIAIDFDGTCVEHLYPDIGSDIGSVPVLLELVKHGHRLILFTMRDGRELDAAVHWFDQNRIPLWGVQRSHDQDWTTSPKCYAHLYIDDAGLGMPLLHTYQGRMLGRPAVDWIKTRILLTERYLFI